MKTIILFLSAFASLSAMADPVITLTKVSTNPSLPPQYRSTFTCSISGDQTTISVSSGVVPSTQGSTVATTYTKAVPSAEVLNSLVGDAARAPVQTVPHPGPHPVGGTTVTYDANIDANPALLLLRSSRVVIQQNNSAAAGSLIELMDLNCPNN